MLESHMRRRTRAFCLPLLVMTAACGGTPTGFADEELDLRFVDGPADHVAGGPIPAFDIWVVDAFGRQHTGLQGGSLTLDLLDPGGGVQSAGFATAPLSFGKGTVAPSITLPGGTGFSVRAHFGQITRDSPPFAVVPAPDVVTMSNPSAGEVGLFVDGHNNIGPVHDNVFRSTATAVDVGVFNSGALTQGAALFASDRRPEMVPITWTSGVDTLHVTLNGPVAIPFTVWIIGGTFAAGQTSVEAALAELETAWLSERAGVVVGDVEFNDATQHVSEFGTFALGVGAPFGPLQNGVGRASGRFNIYVVTQVVVNEQMVSGFGETSGTAIAVAASALGSSGGRAIGHELGHNFGLRDTDATDGFLIDPNMMTTGVSSMFLTEGQIFRAHFDRFSPLRAFRTGDTFPPLSCDPIEATTHCPELAFRLWNESEPAASVAERPRAAR